MFMYLLTEYPLLTILYEKNTNEIKSKRRSRHVSMRSFPLIFSPPQIMGSILLFRLWATAITFPLEQNRRIRRTLQKWRRDGWNTMPSSTKDSKHAGCSAATCPHTCRFTARKQLTYTTPILPPKFQLTLSGFPYSVTEPIFKSLVHFLCSFDLRFQVYFSLTLS